MYKKKILCVDDDPGILDLLNNALEDRFEVFLAPSGAEGLKVIEEHGDLHIVISDHYMQGMTGVEFLTQVQEIRPKSYRFLISGYMDLVDILPMIESGIITRFIKKPWSINSLYRILDSTIKS